MVGFVMVGGDILLWEFKGKKLEISSQPHTKWRLIEANKFSNFDSRVDANTAELNRYFSCINR